MSPPLLEEFTERLRNYLEERGGRDSSIWTLQNPWICGWRTGDPDNWGRVLVPQGSSLDVKSHMPTFQGRHWPGTLSFLHRVFIDPSSTGISGQTFLGKHKGWNPGAREISQSTGGRQRKHSWNSTPIKSRHCALWSPDRHFYADMIESLIKFIHQKPEGNCTILLFCKRNWGQTEEELRQVMQHFSGSHRTLTLLSAC